jgi:hypothetical protein
MKSLMLFFFTWIVVGTVAVWPFPFDSTGKDNQANTQHSEKNTKPSAPFVNQGEAKQSQEGATPTTSSSEPKPVRVTEVPPPEAWYKTYVIATVALVLVGIGGVIGALWTLAIIRRQTNWLSSSERAWVMAELQWPGRLGHVVQDASSTGESNTNIEITLLCRNEGKTPAWIMEKYVRCEITSAIPDTPRPFPAPREQDLHILGPEPLAVGKESGFTGQVQCDGLLRPNLILLVDGFIKYQDVAGETRETRFGYTVDSAAHLNRIMAGKSVNSALSKPLKWNTYT